MKLTKSQKDEIARNARFETFKTRQEQLRQRSNELAILAYDRIYEPVQQSYMAKLPDNFFQQKSTIYVEVKGFKEITVDLISSRKVAASDHHYRLPLLYLENVNDAVTDRFLNFNVEQKQLQEDKSNFDKKMATFLAGIGTLKRLQEEWPEGLPYYKHLMTSPIKNVPAVRGSDVVAMMEEMK